MLGTSMIRKSLTLFTAVAVLFVYTTTALAVPNDGMGEITVTGSVSVNGQSVVSSSTINSGSTIVTGTNSSAIVNLGGNGRVELLSDTSLSLTFNENSIVGSLDSGKIRVSNKAGVVTSFTTKNSTVVADAGQANTFSIDVGCGDSARCTQTFVQTTSGLVTLRSGSTDKQVAAGADASIGNPSQTGCQPCLRPGGGAPVPVAGIGAGALAALLIAAAGAVGAAIFLSKKDNDVDIGGGVIVVSPNR
ncbi:MAG: hypothetical protein KIS76_00975 [Pyrinomonadaceae bacterium]|nr:hypothetical protein [Pyrinomonadaceae bacterium]